jgi:hypothetical protein
MQHHGPVAVCLRTIAPRLLWDLIVGVPAIALDIQVFREVGQGVPELLELDDLDNWKSMILNYAATDSKLRSQQIQRMQSYEPLAWTQHFEQLEALWCTLRS